MERYYFSGSLTDEMVDMLRNMPDFEPLDILVSQVDRSSVDRAIEWKKSGFCNHFFLDSGAYSVHTGKAHITVDEYIDYINSRDEYIEVFAQLDTIPGKYKQPKSKEDYEESSKKSWENYLYMRDRVKSPKKLMPVFHFGEPESALINMLDYRDENGDPLEYIGISPANDAPQNQKNIYLSEVYRLIRSSSNPNVKTHAYGMTSLPALKQFPIYSADSITHRLLSGYGKVMSYNFGVVSVTLRSRVVNTKSNWNFSKIADDYNNKVLEDEFAQLGYTLQDVMDSNAVRVAISIHNIQRLVKDKYNYVESQVARSKRFF